MVYLPLARFASSCGVGVSGAWKFAGGWLVSTTWMLSPAGIRVKLASSEMSYRVVRPGRTGCWLALAAEQHAVCLLDNGARRREHIEHGGQLDFARG